VEVKCDVVIPGAQSNQSGQLAANSNSPKITKIRFDQLQKGTKMGFEGAKDKIGNGMDCGNREKFDFKDTVIKIGPIDFVITAYFLCVHKYMVKAAPVTRSYRLFIHKFKRRLLRTSQKNKQI